MNRKEIIQFGGPTLAFILTSFVLKDLYKINDMMVFTIILVVAGLACLGVGLLRHKSERVQLTFSLAYCVLIMIFAYFYLRPRDTQRDLRADLNGKWQTQSYGTERTPLTIEFLGNFLKSKPSTTISSSTTATRSSPTGASTKSTATVSK